MHCLFRPALFVVVTLVLTPILAAQDTSIEDAPKALTLSEVSLDALTFRHVGPVGNRVPAVVGEPGNPNVYYAGAASGGIWKSDDGGIHWRPVFDDQPVSSIGALAVSASDPNVVWAGTGEGFIRANISIGNGVYRSTDRGESWTHTGLDLTGRIARIATHPTDPDVAYAAALGHCYGPQEDRGLFRTRDGGATWEKVLFVDENTGAVDVVLDPTNPRILFAATWQIEVSTSSRTSGGPGSGLWMSRDGGDNWKRLEDKGLPEPPWGRIGLAMSPADPQRVYALIETNSNRDFAPLDDFQGVLWRSDNGGGSWKMVSADNNLVQRPLYYSRAAVAPDDADEIYFMSVRASRSIDGGTSNARLDEQPGWDHHDLWIDPLDPDRMISGHDGGVSISTTRGRAWHRPLLPIAQMYHVNVDDRVPYFLYGNRQDGPTARVPSNSLTGGEIPIGEWRSVGGCEVGFSIPALDDPNLVWSGCYDGILELHDLESGHSRNVMVWPFAAESWPGIDLDYRWQWTFPMTISPHPPHEVYVGSQFVHRTRDHGHTWETISPDLTTDDPELQMRTGGLTLDDAGPTLAPTVFALAVSPLDGKEIWAGTNDGLVQVTRDGGTSWSDVTTALPDLPPLGTVSNIEPSRHAAGTVYLTVDRHQLGDTDPYVYKSTDFGKAWTRIDAGIERSLWSYAHCVREDPERAGLLYLGTENGIWISFDDGAGWRRLRSNLPPAPVHWLTVQERFADLVVATYGRGFWILDDLTPLRHLDSELLGGEAPVLLPPRDAWRFRRRAPVMSQPNDPTVGTNPEYGASLHYVLPSDLPEDSELELRILDKAGKNEIYAFDTDDLPRSPGLHRMHWNLHSERTPRVKLRTKPDESSHHAVPEKGWRELREGSRIALLMPPGRYTVEIQAGDTVLQQPLEVLKDPASKANKREIAAQMEVLESLHDLLTRTAELINSIEWLRKDLQDLAARLDDAEDGEEAESEHGALAMALREAEESLKEIEGQLFDLRLTGARQDSLRWKRLLYAQISYLAGFIDGTDAPPTASQRERAAELAGIVADHEERYAEILAGEVAALEERLRNAGLGALPALSLLEGSSGSAASPASDDN